MEKEAIKEHYYDFMVESKRLMIFFGFGESRSTTYVAYIVFISAFFFYEMALTAYGSILVLQDKIRLADALLVLVNGLFATWILITRLLMGKVLKRVRGQTSSGFYKYKGEDLFEEQIKMKKEALGEIRIRCRDFFYTWLAGGITVIIFYPVTQAMTVSEEEYERIVDIANPYLPAFFYLPFNTRTPFGLAAAFTITIVYYIYVFGVGMMMNEIYTSNILQLRVQYQILNFSIRNLHKRAIIVYTKMKDISLRAVQFDDILEDNLFQECAHCCLKSNVEHHQVLTRVNDEMQKVNGSLLLLLINIASVAFALDIYIIVQSGKVFESLYSVPWFCYSKNFNQTFRIFMCRTLYPTRVKALLLDLTASLETYANFTSAMYKILNLLK